MLPEKVTGIVLSSSNIGETDRRIVLLTREKGKISAFAKGAVKPRNPLVSSTQAFTFGEYYIYVSGEAYALNNANVLRHFQSFSKNLDKYYYASYMSEVASYYTRENLYAGDELLLLLQSLKALEADTIGEELVRYIFEWRMLSLTGESPNVFACVKCGKTENITHFSVKHHGVLCAECHTHDSDSFQISNGLLYTLQFIMSSKLQNLYTFTVKPNLLEQIKTITNKYMEVHRNVKFNSEVFIDGNF